MQRRENWPELLAQTVEAAKDRDFYYASHGHDCCAFAALCVLAMTGTDFTLNFPPYEGEAQAREVLRGAGGVEAIADLCLGERIALLSAGRGDVVMVPTDHGAALGICIGVNAAFAATRGLVLRPLSDCSAAWRV